MRQKQGFNQLDLLKTRRFLPLFVTQFLTAFNDNVFKNALVILVTWRLVTSVRFSPEMLVTLAAGIFILPFFLFSAIAGQIADRFEKSRLIQCIKVFEIFLMSGAAAGLYCQNVYVLLTALFLLGTEAAFFGPAKYAILPESLHAHELIAGNALIEAATFIAILLGTIVGGLLILRTEGKTVITTLLCAGSLCGFVASLLISDTGKSQPRLRMNPHFLKEILQLIRYAGSRQEIRQGILGISWFWLVGAVFVAEFPIFVRYTLHADEAVVTLFYSLFSVGIACGSLLCNRLLKGKVDVAYVPLCALGMTLFMADLYLASKSTPRVTDTLISPLSFLKTLNGARITLDVWLLAVFGGLYTVPLYALVQKCSEPTRRARVIASNNIINALFMVLAASGTAILFRLRFTVEGIFLVVAGLNALFALWFRQTDVCRSRPD